MADMNRNMNFEETLKNRVHAAGVRQQAARGMVPENKPRTWEEIEAYAEWVAAIRVREELLSLQREVC